MSAYTDEDLREAVALVAQHGSPTAAAKALGFEATGQRRLRRVYARAVERGMTGHALGAVPAGYRIKGHSTFFDRDGKVRGQWVKDERERVTLDDALEAIRAAFADVEPVEPVTAPEGVHDDLWGFLFVADLHFLMKAWREATGDNYDVKIAGAALRGAVRRMLGRMPRMKGLTVVMLGDFFHGDVGMSETERSGHRLDMADTRWTKGHVIATDLCAAVIDLGRGVAETVEFSTVPGNHDRRSAWYLAHGLAERYRADPRVTVDLAPTAFKWKVWGEALVSWSHGHLQTAAQMAERVATECRGVWSSVRRSDGFRGHEHRQGLVTRAGTTVRTLLPLTVRDGYAADAMYDGERGMLAVVYDLHAGATIHDLRLPLAPETP